MTHATLSQNAHGGSFNFTSRHCDITSAASSAVHGVLRYGMHKFLWKHDIAVPGNDDDEFMERTYIPTYNAVIISLKGENPCWGADFIIGVSESSPKQI